MIELNWMTILESQQEDFIMRLKAWFPAFYKARYDFSEASHIYSVLLDDDYTMEQQMNNFCYALTEKSNGYYNPDKFMNYKIGKIGEESVKDYLLNLITSVNYELYEYGDNGIDFYLQNNR